MAPQGEDSRCLAAEYIYAACAAIKLYVFFSIGGCDVAPLVASVAPSAI